VCTSTLTVLRLKDYLSSHGNPLNIMPEETKAVEGYTLTVAEAIALADIREGADIISYVLAELLRKLESKYPDLLTITKPMGEYSVKERLPYFGAILTQKGSEVLNALKKAEELPS